LKRGYPRDIFGGCSTPLLFSVNGSWIEWHKQIENNKCFANAVN